MFTQRVGIPMLYANAIEPGNPTGGCSGGIGKVLVEEKLKTPHLGRVR
ncbi:MAG: hypothetical protein KDG44_11210 [Burkholderiaceae bacterium]|nr:hypothetical protein [Burkholderiaceae bacterium]